MEMPYRHLTFEFNNKLLYSRAMRKMPSLTLIMILALPAMAMAAPTPLAIDPGPMPQQWRLPVDNGRVSSFFGTMRGHRAHGGIDFSVPNDTPVVATDSGIVVASANHYKGDRKYGNVVVIEHDNGLRSLYAHLNKRDVRVGDEVAAGDAIGLSGSTGHSTGPHLHLEAYRDAARIDPGALLQANLRANALPSATHTRLAVTHARKQGKATKHVAVRSRKKVRLANTSSKHRKA